MIDFIICQSEQKSKCLLSFLYVVKVSRVKVLRKCLRCRVPRHLVGGNFFARTFSLNFYIAPILACLYAV